MTCAYANYDVDPRTRLPVLIGPRCGLPSTHIYGAISLCEKHAAKMVEAMPNEAARIKPMEVNHG